jgi:hypothetical protein
MAGVPEHLVGSTLEHPELGPLGTMIRDLQLTTYLIVVHEPQSQTTRVRRNTFGGYLAADPGLRSGSPPMTPDEKSMAGGVASPSDISLTISAPSTAMKRMFDKKDAELYPIHEDLEGDDTEHERRSDNRSRVSSGSSAGKALSYKDVLSRGGKDKAGDEMKGDSTSGTATAAVTMQDQGPVSDTGNDNIDGEEDEQDQDQEGKPDTSVA